MLNESLKMKGRLRIELNGKVVRDIDNLVVTVGKNFVASRMTGTSPAVMSHMAVGATNTAAANGDTTLAAEAARVALGSASTTDAIATYTAVFPAGTGTGALVEAGLFNAGSAGTMLARTVFAVVNKGAADAMTITWTVTVS